MSEEVKLLPCPLCGEALEIRTGVNPYGRHAKGSDCFIAAYAVNIPYDVERWNRRADPAPQPATSTVEVEPVNIKAMLRSAFEEGRISTHGTDRHYGERAWANSEASRVDVALVPASALYAALEDKKRAVDALNLALVACKAAWDSISRYPGSVHDRAMSKLGRALQGKSEFRDYELDDAVARAEKAEAALRKIAAYDDEGANANLARTGSYGSFDAPGAVQVAREALRQADQEKSP